MTETHRRTLLKGALGAAAFAAFPPAIARALAIPADVRSGTLRDVEHVVILMQENRSFDHYFGTLRGVRGFADRFPIPLPGAPARTVWDQLDRKADGGPRMVSPFHLATRQDWALMRMEGTPHGWPDAQRAWDEGRMAHWPEAKTERAMGYYRREDIPFQFALADAFTICDAYHCSVQTGTNTNRLFLWTGTNDPLRRGNGPSTDNSHDWFNENPADDYTWTTYPERLQQAGISWQVYQNMADNFTDNSLEGFRNFRLAHEQRDSNPGNPLLKGVTTTMPAGMRKAGRWARTSTSPRTSVTRPSGPRGKWMSCWASSSALAASRSWR